MISLIVISVFICLSSLPSPGHTYYHSQSPENFNATNGQIRVMFEWKFLDWVFPTVQLTGKNFTLGNALTQDVDIDRKGRVFITSPQWLEGTPVTLSMITSLRGEGGPLLTPYPDVAWHTSNCNGLVSVYRVAIDECNRLWAVDTGKVARRSVCPMKIMVFDLSTDRLIKKYIIPAEQTVNDTAAYVNPIVQIGDSCDETFLYVADVIQHGVLVYSLSENRSWRMNNTKNNIFGHDLDAVNLTIAGEKIQLDDGILGMALSPPNLFSKRYLYFNSLASFYQKFMEVDSLKRSFIYEPIAYQSLFKRPSQAGVQVISKTGASFFQLADMTALACWNVQKPFVSENIVIISQNEELLQYVSGMKILLNSIGEEELWFNTNRLQKTINNSRKIDEVNYRIIRGKVNDLIRNTKCLPSQSKVLEPDLSKWQRI